MSEIKRLDTKTRKLLTIHRMHHPKADVNRMYLPRRIGGRGLTKLETAYKSTTIGLEKNLRNTDDALLQLVLQHETKKKLYSIQKEAEKFKREFEVPNLEREANERITKFAGKIGTEALLCAAQHYDKTSESPLCRLCEKKCESVQHLVCGCEKLAQKEYKRRHDNVAKKVHWDFCKKNKLEHTEKWYEHVPEGAVENEEVKVLWDINVQCDNVIEARRPDIIVIDKKERKGIIIDIAVPADARLGGKEREKWKNTRT
ncbi:uncharacterized protein [Montipora foliosa]|uniref:uncharacterized protein n=1 Tax=Montipora foliosa TaxID=591990 RepID=UPI0035F13578